MNKGLLIILSGPSGVGKGTVRAELFKRNNLNLAFSISMTTRSPRVNEVNGVDYFFVDQETFNNAVKENKMLEHADFVSHSYGTPKDYVEKLRNEGKNVVLEIEVCGAKQVMEKCKDALSIFIVPPSIDELRYRLIGRKTESMDVIEKRVETAKKELEEAKLYKYNVVNDTVERCANAIESIILKEMNK